MLESIFETLFKYRPSVFAQGTVALDPPFAPAVLWALGGIAVAWAIAGYIRAGELARWERGVLMGLRVTVILGVVVALHRPVLRLSTVVPQQNFLGVLVDDSRSMGIGDASGRTRAAVAAELLDPENGLLLPALQERFKLRTFRFADGARRLGSLAELQQSGTRTELGAALTQAARELAGVPLAGLVVLTDGADNGQGVVDDAVRELAASGIPVYPVGIGAEQFPRDLEVARVAAPREVLVASSVAAEVSLQHAGYRGRTVTVIVEDERQILAQRDLELSRTSDVTTTTVRFTPRDPGVRKLRVSVAEQEDEVLRENNRTELLLTVRDDRPRILVFDGEPRPEITFLRRALDDDPFLRLVILQRTAKDKFYRIGVEDSTELLAGFPTEREVLFQFDGLVLGSVEASFFTRDQLRMIAEFVERRGGGLLVLGGRSALDAGGYARTAIAEALPVVFDGSAETEPAEPLEIRIERTPGGRLHAALQLADDSTAGDDAWVGLPSLTTFHRLHDLKPGATSLLSGRVTSGGRDLVVMAVQRYGRGRSAVFAVQDSWLWRMHGDIALDDRRHETLWRQLLRWLVTDVPSPVTATAWPDRVEPGAEIDLLAEVTDSGFVYVNGAVVSATVTTPSGRVDELPLEWTVARDGQYHATYRPGETGRYEARIVAERGGATMGERVVHFEAADLQREYFGATMRRHLLEQVAEQTGGRFYTADRVSALPEDVSITERGATVVEERDLWDMPFLFVLLVGCLGVEWTFRRARGLA
jgi:uncharacterized membrane protein